MGSLFGMSSVGFGMAGGGAAGIPAFSLWGPPNLQGSPLTSGFVLGFPEPSSIALVAVGVVVFAFRRRPGREGNAKL
jgi:hypothetical protein